MMGKLWPLYSLSQNAVDILSWMRQQSSHLTQWCKRKRGDQCAFSINRQRSSRVVLVLGAPLPLLWVLHIETGLCSEEFPARWPKLDLFLPVSSSSSCHRPRAERTTPPGACQKSSTHHPLPHLSPAGLRTSHSAPFFSLSAHLFLLLISLLCLFHAYQCVSLRGKCLRLNPNRSRGWYYPRSPSLLLPQQLSVPSITPSSLPPFMAPPKRRLRNIFLPFYAYKRKIGEKADDARPPPVSPPPSITLPFSHRSVFGLESAAALHVGSQPPPQPTPSEPEQKGRHLSLTSSVRKHSLCLGKCFKNVFGSGAFSQLFQCRGGCSRCIIITVLLASRGVLLLLAGYWLRFRAAEEEQVEIFACINIIVRVAPPEKRNRPRGCVTSPPAPDSMTLLVL